MAKLSKLLVVSARVFNACLTAYINGALKSTSRARGSTMAFDKKAWMRTYMRAYRRGKHRKPRPGYFDKKAWSRSYMRKVRARQKLERERDEAVNGAMARLTNRTPAADLCVNDRLAPSESIMADMRLVLEEVKAPQSPHDIKEDFDLHNGRPVNAGPERKHWMTR